MILFVFEGKRREPDIYRTLEFLFFPKGQTIVCSFGNNIYELYRQLKALDGGGDIVSILREKYRDSPESPFGPDSKSSDFSEIFLFFDYDFQNRNLTMEQMNRQLSEMLEHFDDETENGKLYVNYPMIEAIRYTKELPDDHFFEYTVSRTSCRDQGFKDLVQQFSAYGSLDFIVLNLRRVPDRKKIDIVKENWSYLESQNVVKANYICNNALSMPLTKESISQDKIFDAQISKYIEPHSEVSILSAFPLFNYDYFKHVDSPHIPNSSKC